MSEFMEFPEIFCNVTIFFIGWIFGVITKALWNTGAKQEHEQR